MGVNEHEKNSVVIYMDECKWTWEKFILHYNSDYTWVINIYIYNDVMKVSCPLQFLFTFQFNMCRNTYQPIRRYTDNVSETERN